jgi:hypothetical protein
MSEESVLFFHNAYCPKARRGTDFQEEIFFPHERGVAFHDGNTLFALPLPGATRPDVHYLHHPPVSLQDLKTWVRNTFGDSEPTEATYLPGTVYKRIYRPVACGNYYRAVSQEKLTSTLVSLRILLTKLDDLFEIIEPTPDNLATYGHGIREVLLLACMDVESSWSAVLRENGYVTAGALTTNDYVKLLAAMLLDCYTLSLQSYPHLPSFAPFKGWNGASPTKSLVWYDAYNKTKHNREENLKFATLHNAIQAVGAAAIMLHAQFGFYFGQAAAMIQTSPAMIRNMFNVASDFTGHWQECYIPQYSYKPNTEGSSMGSFDWEAINYPF